MAVYSISYDLRKPGRNYDDLYDAIKGCSVDWWHCLESTWMIVTDMSAARVRDALRAEIDTNDKLLVVTLQKGAAWHGLPSNCEDWIRKYL